MAYDKINPFTIDRSEYSLAILSSMIANFMTNGRKNFKAKDFLINSKTRKETDFDEIQKTLGMLYGNN